MTITHKHAKHKSDFRHLGLKTAFARLPVADQFTILSAMTPDHSIVLPCELIDRLAKECRNWTGLVALITVYLRLAHEQRTQYVRCENEDAAHKLGWCVRKLKAHKTRLLKLGIISNFSRRDRANKIVGWYVKICIPLPKTTGAENALVERVKSKKKYGILKPRVVDDMLGRVVCGDCLQLMPHIPDGTVNLICTDLPFGNTTHPWDVIIPLQPMWSEFYRCLAPEGAIVLFSAQPLTSILVASNMARYKHSWVWDKTTGGSPLNVKISPRKIHEDILVFGNSSGKTTYNPEMVPRQKPVCSVKKGEAYFGGKRTTDFLANYTHYYPTSILRYSKRSEPDGFLHPSQKPIELIRYIVRTYSHPGEVVLDACCGSGTTGVACVLENRKYIMIDSDKKIVEVARHRIGKYQTPTLG